MSFEINSAVMNDTVDYTINEDNRTLIRAFKGKTNLDSVIDSWNYILDSGLLEGMLGVISDYRFTDMNISMSEIALLSEYYEKNSEIFHTLKLTQVINSPKVIFPKLFKEENPHLKTMHFNTIQLATEWILFEISLDGQELYG